MKRHELRKLANKKHQDPLNTIIREQYHDTLAQYKKLLNPTQQNICNKLRQNECHGQHSRPLDFMITEREIRKAAEKLKNNKSPFSDKIRNEMIKLSIDTLMPVYEKLFNSILNQGTMHRLGVVVLLLPFINRADEAIQQTTGESVSPAAWENYFVLS